MKQTIKSLMMGALMMALPFLFTSCEDILGHWEKPTPATPSVEEMLTNLSSALEEGALVTITYTVDGVTYTSTFKKVGDEYVEQSTTSASRALTRAGTSVQAQLQYMPSTAVFNVLVFQDNNVVLNLEINSNDGTIDQTFSNGAEFKGVTVNGQKAKTTTYNDQTIKVLRSGSGTFLGIIGYKDDETWEDLHKRESKNGNMIIQIIGSAVYYSNGGVSGRLYYKNGDSYTPVRSNKQIFKDVYVEVETISYRAASWNNSTNEVKYTSRITESFTLVSPSKRDVTWGAGTFVVKSDVTIGGDLNLDGDVNLILCDDAKLTVNGEINGKINGNSKSLTIYSQSQGDNAGKLVMPSGGHGIQNFSDLTIHGGNITINSGGSGIEDTQLTVYGGKLTIESDNSAIDTGSGNDMTVYGGEIEAISGIEAGIYLLYGNGTPGILTVYGGKVTAQGAEGKPAIKGYFKAGEGMTGEGKTIKYRVSTDGSVWGDESNMQTTPRQLGNEDRYFEAWRPTN